MNKFLFKIFLIIPIVFFTYSQNASEILIYADYISYDKSNNLIAKGNAKIISGDEIILSDLILFDKEKNIFTLPKKFTYKDKNNNYFYGSEGTFDKNLTNAEIINVKMLLNDGSRIVGDKSVRYKEIDIINKELQNFNKE